VGKIMRLAAGLDGRPPHRSDVNNGERHEAAFSLNLIRDNALLVDAELLPRSYGGTR